MMITVDAILVLRLEVLMTMIMTLVLHHQTIVAAIDIGMVRVVVLVRAVVVIASSPLLATALAAIITTSLLIVVVLALFAIGFMVLTAIVCVCTLIGGNDVT